MLYRNISIINASNVPKSGPVILCGNHANQFVDALMLISTCDREISFIIAAKSYRRNIIGHIARMVNAIPVERP